MSRSASVPSGVFRKMIEILSSLRQTRGVEEFARLLLERIGEIVPAQTLIYGISTTAAEGMSRSETHVCRHLPEAGWDEYSLRSWRIDPVRAAAMKGRMDGMVLRSSDYLTWPALRDTQYYSDFLKPFDIAHYAAVCLPAKRGIAAFGLHRPAGAGFSDGEMEAMRVFAPLLADAYSQCEIKEQALTAKEASEFRLTKRQGEIAGLVAKGLPNRQVARKLCITEQTVKDHLRLIYRKMGVNTRCAMTRKMLASPAAD